MSDARQTPWIPRDTFAHRLMLVRRELGLTQEEASELCGLDNGSWSNWEHGRRPRAMDVVVATIADKLGCDRDWLMWGKPAAGGTDRVNSSTVGYLSCLPASRYADISGKAA